MLYKITFIYRSDKMSKQAITQFGFKPGALWRHYITTIGNIKKLLNAHGVQTKCQLHFSAVHSFFQFRQTTYAANKVQAFVSPRVVYI